MSQVPYRLRYTARLSYTGGLVLPNKGISFTHITSCLILHQEMTLKTHNFSDTSFQQVPLTGYITVLCILDPLHLNNYL